MKPHSMVAAVALVLAGCAGIPQNVPPGTPREQVVQALGQPTATHALAAGTRLQYSRQPFGRQVYNIDLDAAGRVVSVVQVLQPGIMFRVPVDGSRRVADVQREFGTPAFVAEVYSFDGPIWTYRFEEVGIPRLFHIYLDRQGVVRRAHATDEPIRPWVGD